MSVMLADQDAAVVDPVAAGAGELLAEARAHRCTQGDDCCAGCGWHWPCPAFFHARRALIAAQVPPALWAVR
jgi:hypothetical protein